MKLAEHTVEGESSAQKMAFNTIIHVTELQSKGLAKCICSRKKFAL